MIVDIIVQSEACRIHRAIQAVQEMQVIQAPLSLAGARKIQVVICMALEADVTGSIPREIRTTASANPLVYAKPWTLVSSNNSLLKATTAR